MENQNYLNENFGDNVNYEEISHFDNLADSWWIKDGKFKTLHLLNDIRVKWINDFVNIYKDKKILDVGCGGGILSETLSSLGGLVTGIDMSKKSIEIAKYHCRNYDVKPKYYRTSIELFEKTSSEKFDIITCMEMLEHVDNPISIINSCKNLLNDDGVIVLSTINRNLKSFLYAILGGEYIFNILPRGTHKYESFIKPSELYKIIIHHGLDLIDIIGISYNPFLEKFYLSKDVNINYMMMIKKKNYNY
ncbi:Ubiquinone biosynthesis O-methyltransferase [Candidatus Kinetoplastibacterium sorsogonicusi]|uniref:Ubiquinone biosynthesis O-methyltransferase n=1 Tax=Candidatus Kinetoplastidibacterium kentomonadis TaxID=1576550 RepID=A0A3S7JA36_9PROT|nr:bifunctional 2-polyprenyl-6-hydroxyphenol methylase/3-demethylubiquinol 3-O-methyltransferase UbiG [Candidatus Kinetoplastibacterium sorsogonicusi]AWD32533.1 Ubiquinone biosynthesis O-methyltransferase [Candidatus Kinetoplastibacterium sorsogonicusi]